jgi:thioester reductase-like protein
MGNTNELMMTNIISLIEKIKVPLYYVSTAYLCKPNNEPLFNKYEEDKQAAENVLNSSNVSSTIFRPSIITGNSKTGEIVNFSGYYLMVQALIKFLENSDKIRFPSIDNYINIVPVDWVAESIVSKVEENSRGTFFITNTNPPLFNDLLIETLKFFKIDHKINLVDCSFEEYDHLDLNSTEREIFDRCKAFIPYIETKYHFQNSIYDAILEPNYIQKILSYFVKSKNERME